MPILSIRVRTCLRPTAKPSSLSMSRSHAGTGEGEVQVQLVEASHQHQVGLAYRLGQVIDIGARDLEQLGLPAHRKIVTGIDHFFALAPSMRPSAPAKKSFSNAS